MTIHTKTLSDVLPAQEHYYLLYNGMNYARHGTPEANGLLVFGTLEQAEQFCLTVGMALPAFQPVRVDVEEFMRLVEDIGAVCVTHGYKVMVGTLGPRRSRRGTQPASEQQPANPEGVLPEDSNWVPADQIPAVIETGREIRADTDAPNGIDELFRAAADLERLGLLEDAKRIRESVSALVRQMRRKWLMSSNYIPWNDEEWVDCSNAIPEEMEDHPEFLDGWRAIVRDVECVRQRTTSERTRRSQKPSS